MGRAKFDIFNKKTRLNLLIGFFWLLPVLLSTFSGNIKLMFSGINLLTVAIYGIVFILLFINLNHVFFKISSFDILFFIFILLSVGATMILFPQNTPYIKQAIYNWSFTFVYYFIGKLIARTVSAQDVLCSISKYGIILSYIAYVTTFGITDKDMTFAYTVLAYVVMTANGGFNKNKLTYIYWSVAGIVLLFVLGTRGPLLFAVLYILYRCFLKMGKGWKIFLLSFFGISMALFVETKAYYSVLQTLDDFLRNRNIKSYIINQILTENIVSEEQRFNALKGVAQALWERPFGYGIFGDRVILNGIYVHNVIAELLCAFGVVLGTIIIILFVRFIFKAIKNAKHFNRMHFVIAFIFIFFFKFFVSNSIFIDTFFGLLMGLLSFFYMNGEKKESKWLIRKQ